MSVFRAAAIRSFRRVQPSSASAQTFTEWLASTDGDNGPTRHWQMDETNGTTMVADVGAINCTYQNAIELNITDAEAEKWVGFDAAAVSPAHATGTTLLQSAEFTVLMALQVDAHAVKHIPLTMGTVAATAGAFSVELIDDGSGGLKPRVWSVSSVPEFVIYAGTALGTIPIGEPFWLFYLRRSDGTQEVWTVDRLGAVSQLALTLDSGTKPGSWPAHPSGTWYIGAWSTGAAPFNGVMRSLVLWDIALSASDIIALGTIDTGLQRVVWARDLDAGTIEAELTHDNIAVVSHIHPEVNTTLSVVNGTGSLGTLSANGTALQYVAGAVPGTDTTPTWRVTKDSINSPTAGFEIDVAAAPTPEDLPYSGQFYGCAYWGATAGNSRLRAGAPDGESWFFRPWRTGTVTGLHWHVRSRNVTGSGAASGYSAGNGGTYTLQIRPANPATRRPVPGSSPICQFVGYAPGNPTTADRHIYPTINFTTTGQVTAGQPYCVVAINTAGSGNYVSMNTNNQASFWEDVPEPSNYTEPARGNGTSGVVVASGGTEADAVGATAVRVAGWAPTRIDGTVYDPYPIHTQDGILRGRCLGAGFYELIYSDGVISQNGAWGSEGDYKVDINGSNQFRLRFRPSRGDVTVSGVYIRSSRNGSGAGNVVVTLEEGPNTDAHFPNSNGTQIAQASCNVSLFLDCGTSEQISQISAEGATMELTHWVWIPFSSPVTFSDDTWYTVRLSATSSAFLRYWGTGRGEGTPGFGVDGRLSTWAQWEAGREIAREGFDDCRDGSEVSTDGGTTWVEQPGGARMHPLLFKCV